MYAIAVGVKKKHDEIDLEIKPSGGLKEAVDLEAYPEENLRKLFDELIEADINILYKYRFSKNSKKRFLALLAYWVMHRNELLFTQEEIKKNKKKYKDILLFLVVSACQTG